MALETRHVGQGRDNVLAYYKFTPPLDTYKASMLVTTELQLREMLQIVEQLGADEVVLFTWSNEIEQIDRIANLIG